MGDRPDCYLCVHHRNVPGDCHIECVHPSAYTLKVKGSGHGVRMGWFVFPWNFDPVWLETCNGFTARSAPAPSGEREGK